MKRLSSFILAVTMTVSLVTGCATATEAAEDKVTFGISCAVTGNFPLAGERTLQGINLAVKEINASGGVLGKELAYVQEDDGNDATQAVNVVTKLLNEGVCAVIGPHTSGNALATQELYLETGIPFMTGGSSPKLLEMENPFLFQVRPCDIICGQVAAKYAMESLGATKIGISYNNNDFGTAGRDVITAYLDEAGVEYVAEGHNSGDKDMTSQFMKFMGAGVDCIISWTDDAEVVVTARQLYELGMNVPVIASAGVVMDQVLDLMETEYVDNWYAVTDFVSTNDDVVVSKFVESFEAEYGIKPELYASCYYGATYALADAIERAGSDDPEAVRAALAETTDLAMPTGVMTCDENGSMIHGCVIAQINDKVPTVVEYVEVDG